MYPKYSKKAFDNLVTGDETWVYHCPKTGLKHLRILHENAPAHKASLVIEFLESEKVTFLPYPSFSVDQPFPGPLSLPFYNRMFNTRTDFWYCKGRFEPSLKIASYTTRQILFTFPCSPHIHAFHMAVRHMFACCKLYLKLNVRESCFTYNHEHMHEIYDFCQDLLFAVTSYLCLHSCFRYTQLKICFVNHTRGCQRLL